MPLYDFRCEGCHDWMLDVFKERATSFPCDCGGTYVWVPTQMRVNGITEKRNEIDFENYNTYEQRLKAAKMYFKRREERGDLPQEFKSMRVEDFVPPGDGIDMREHLETLHKKQTTELAQIDEGLRQADREMNQLSKERQQEISVAFAKKNELRGRGRDLASENIKVLDS